MLIESGALTGHCGLDKYVSFWAEWEQRLHILPLSSPLSCPLANTRNSVACMCQTGCVIKRDISAVNSQSPTLEIK